jgi:fucose permease
MKADHAYIGLSLFWLAMIPARILCGYFSRWNRQILISASLGAAVLSLLIGVTTDGTVAIVLCLPLGFFCGAIYPSVLSRSLDFAGGKTATATGMITAATGLGGAAITALTGLISQQFGINRAFIFLSLFISADFFISLLLFFGHHSKGIKEAPGK